VFGIVAARHFPSETWLHTPAAAVSIFWTASARRGSVTSAWTAVYALAKLTAVFVHDRVLSAFCAAMRGVSDRDRRVDVWDSHVLAAASSSDADASWQSSSAPRGKHRPPRSCPHLHARRAVHGTE
jgi:hypothetical protein